MMEPVVWRHLKLLNDLRKINLSLEETAALIRRLKTNSCRPEDDEVLIRRQGANSTRRRHRR